MRDWDISLENVSFAYDGDDVLDRVNLRVEKGAFLAVIGPNGGGKTTFVKLLLGLLRPRQGKITVLGKDPAQKPPNVGYVPQHAAFAPSFPITVQDVGASATAPVSRGGSRGTAIFTAPDAEKWNASPRTFWLSIRMS